ncbi:N-acetylmuramoyl-L-alanine amidase [Paenibacillus sp. 19GGS1-52]|uniref:N-acetylmuramoyl-L-alanine amidase family protein n=1 Tax=Paenibacillus sp. 19GGS1-52 TaxID=2758563 RepID=UPI001EFACCEC|nr:N-acetylmuramoyl-L-alanine amidase family protein [Paenibacillus sp. 19GGS1-52]ULO09247.1 N-acetylmuramoyl-L-alanine amidase [Paenibacillus sp. 19GGS1-52]
MKKYGFLAMLLILLIVVFPRSSHAESVETHINLDGNELTISKDAQVQIVNGSVMVPLRLVTEQLGYSVKWDNVTKTAIIEQANTTLKLVVNNTTAEVSGRQVQLDNPPFLSGSITLVPLRFVGEETGTTVGWDNLTKTVYLTSTAKAAGYNASTATNQVAVPDSEPSLLPETKTEISGSPADGESASEHTNQAELTNLSFSDNRLIIAVNGNLSPSTFTMTAKDRIVIDLPNTRFAPSFSQSQSLANSQSGQMVVTGYPDVSAVRYSLFSNSPAAIRVVIDLNSAKTYSVINNNDGLIIIDLNGTGIDPASPTGTATTIADPAGITFPSATPPATSGKRLVVIDAGHGGKDPGSVSLNKHSEKDFTLATVLKVAELLKNEPNIAFVLTRSDDSYPTLQQRAKIANDLKADLFLSIHANSIPTGSTSNPSGFETYYSRPESLQFATTVHKHLVPASGLSDRGIRKSSLYVTRETKMPAILLECGYLSNANDESLLYSADYQQRIAAAVVAGIKEYLGL